MPQPLLDVCRTAERAGAISELGETQSLAVIGDYPYHFEGTLAFSCSFLGPKTTAAEAGCFGPPNSANTRSFFFPLP